MIDALTAGDTLTIDGIEHIVVGYGVSGRLVTVTHQGRAVDVYADGKIVHGKLKTTKVYGRKDETSMPPRVQVSPDQLGAIRALLLEGHSTSSISVVYGHARSWVGDVAKLAGLRYVKTGPQSGHWVQQQGEASMTDEKWDMTTEDYTALITPDRERAAANGSAGAPVVRDDPAPEGPALRGTIEDDIKEAIELLGEAEKQRKLDIASIERLTVKANQSRDEGIQLEAALRESEQRARQLESEVSRLHDEIKKEISRGVLRERMDGVRQALK